MSWDPLGSTHGVVRPVDNSRVVREVDPRTSRDLWSLVLLIGTLVTALALYGWPHFASRQTSAAVERSQQERDQLLEQNRKLKLERAALEDLRRVEVIAARDLKMSPPAAERVVVVEVSQQPGGVQRAAAGRAHAGVEN
jgi:cell division protein FtsL